MLNPHHFNVQDLSGVLFFHEYISYQGPKTIDFITVVINFLVTQDFGAGRKFNMFSLVLVYLHLNCT